MTTMFEKLLDDPRSILSERYDQAFTLSRQEIGELHRKYASCRFNEFRPRIKMLDKLATEQNIEGISEINDIIPLLYPHTIYKSYPTSYIERNQYEKLTRWLGGLTTVDLGSVDMAGLDSMDGWLDRLDQQTDLRVFHTSGTSGKLSFIPRTEAEWREVIIFTARRIRDWYGPNTGPDVLEQHRPIISPGYRRGAANVQRATDLQVEMIAGSEEEALFLYPDTRFSADVASLSGRLRAAEARGEQGALQIPPALVARRQELMETERNRHEDIRRFFDEAQSRFAGRDVYINAMWAIVYDLASEGLKRGVKGVFGAGSILATGGGKKGVDLPDNWRDIVHEFLGFDRTYEMYGCSELMTQCPRCEAGNYHIPPVIVPFLLDPKTGEGLPREDGVVGRYAALDLLPRTYWSGIITGDEVTIRGWEKSCDCGRLGPHLLPDIRRYSEIEGGDDKIVCAGAPEAHDHALAFLAQLAS